MTVAAAAVFAQVIPVLLIAAFLSGVRINRNDRTATISALIYIGFGALAEGTCLVYVAVDQDPPEIVLYLSLSAAFLLLVALIATTVQKLADDEKSDRGTRGQ